MLSIAYGFTMAYVLAQTIYHVRNKAPACGAGSLVSDVRSHVLHGCDGD